MALYLISCVGVRHDLPNLDHFVRHYKIPGIAQEDFRLILQATDPESPRLAAARGILRRRGAPDGPLDRALFEPHHVGGPPPPAGRRRRRLGLGGLGGCGRAARISRASSATSRSTTRGADTSRAIATFTGHAARALSLRPASRARPRRAAHRGDLADGRGAGSSTCSRGNRRSRPRRTERPEKPAKATSFGTGALSCRAAADAIGRSKGSLRSGSRKPACGPVPAVNGAGRPPRSRRMSGIR